MPSITEKRGHPLSTLELDDLDLTFLNSQRWEDWEETGFNIRQQIRGLAFGYQSKISEGISPQQALSEWTQETAEDLKGFWFEFVRQYLILPIKIEKHFIDGKWEIVAPRYSNKPLTEIAKPEERNGAVKEALEKVTGFLVNAPRNSVAILISPSGWSGLKAENGNRIIYPETQIYLYKVNIFGQIEAITVRVSNSLFQNQTLYSLLSGGQLLSSGLSSEQKIETLVRYPILKNGLESQVEFEEVIRIIEQVHGSRYALDHWVTTPRGDIHVQRTFAELWQHFRNRHVISQLEERADFVAENQKAKWLIDNFRHFMENFEFLDFDSLEIIAGELDKVLRNLYRIKERPAFDPQYGQITLTEFERQKEMREIQSLFGCQGVSSGLGIMMTSFGARTYTVEPGTKFYHCGACNKTGQFSENELPNGRPNCDKAIASR